MVAFDAAVLRADPAKIALGATTPGELEAASNNPEGPACAASLSAFQSALVWRNIFTAIVAVLAALTLVALAFCIYKIVDDQWDAAGTITALGGVVTGVAALFLQRERTKSINVLRTALEDVGTYCGITVKKQLT